MRSAFLLIVFTGLSGLLFAQTRLKDKGDQYFGRLGYAKAIPYYEKVYKKDHSAEVAFKLAECYRLTQDYPAAKNWYELALKDVNTPGAAWYYYAHALLTVRDWDGAMEAFRKYSRMTGDSRGERFAAQVKDLRALEDPDPSVSVWEMPVNSRYADLSPMPFGEGKLVFASSRDEGSAIRQDFRWMETPFLDLYITKQKDSLDWTKPDPMPGEINTRLHESNFTWYEGGQEAYFTRNNLLDEQGESDEGIILLKIYAADMEGDKGSNIREFPYNSDNYSVTHPILSADGNTLYFTSDMPGGEGGKDIYKVTLKNGSWSKPENLGKDINTPMDEMFPFIHPSGKLYFASNGHPGLGNLDIFEASPNGGRWTLRNLGAPVNTAFDDFGYYLNGEETGGYLVSNRPGGTGSDDIYAFTQRKTRVEVLVVDKYTGDPVKGAALSVQVDGNPAGQMFTTDAEGRISYVSNFDVHYQANVKALDYNPGRVSMFTDSRDYKEVYEYVVELGYDPPFFSAKVIDAHTDEPIPQSAVRFVRLDTRAEKLDTANHNARFVIKLEQEVRYRLEVTHEGYYRYVDTVYALGRVYNGDTLIPLDMKPIEQQRVVVLENIHYDFDKWNIREDAKKPLDELAALLMDNPQIRIELGSHTDCRGTNEYNRILSQRRADSAREYLIKRGIEAERIIAKGYGESLPRNKCVDGQSCSEAEHQENRRTEFKVIGIIPGVDLSKSVLDTGLK